jgi:hypothetical protein
VRADRGPRLQHRGRSCSGSIIRRYVANAQALHDLENGANGLTLAFAGANGAMVSTGAFGGSHRGCSTASIDANPIELQIVRSREWRNSSPNISAQALSPAAAISVSARSDRRLRGLGIQPYSRRIVPAVTSGPGLRPRLHGPFASRRKVIHDAADRKCRSWRLLATGVAYLRAIESAGSRSKTPKRDLCWLSAVRSVLTMANSARCGCCGRGSKQPAASPQKRCSSPPTPHGGC